MKRYLMLLAKLVIVTLCVYFLWKYLRTSVNVSLYNLDWSAFKIPFSLATFIVGFYLAACVVSAYTLSLTAKYMGYHIDITFSWILQGLYLPGAYLPGKIWSAAGQTYLLNRQGISLVDASTILLINQLETAVAGLAIGIVVINLAVKPLLGNSSLFVITVALSLCILIMMLHPKSMKLIGIAAGKLLRRQIVLNGLSFRQMLTLFIVKIFYFIIYSIGYYMIVAYYSSKSDLDSLKIIASYPLANTIGFLSFMVPSGIGVREFILSAILKHEQIAAVNILVIIIASRIWTTVGEGLLYLSSLSLYKLMKRPELRKAS